MGGDTSALAFARMVWILPGLLVRNPQGDTGKRGCDAGCRISELAVEAAAAAVASWEITGSSLVLS